MEDLLQYFDFSEVDSVTAKLAGTDTVSFSDLFGLFIKGDFTGACKLLMQELGQLFFPGITAFREILLAILGIGMVAMLLHYLAGFVKNKQVADMTAYFIYLLMMILLFRYVTTMLSISKQNLENLREFMSVLVPGYFLSVSLAGGSVAAAVNYQFFLLLLMGVDYILLNLLLPCSKGCIYLAVMNGIDDRGRMKELIRLAERTISLGIKLCLTVTVSVSTMQNLIASKLDGVQKSLLQRAIGSIPGIGDLSESMVQVFMGSAGLIRNTIGTAGMCMLFFIMIKPMFRIFCILAAMKLGGACLGLMGLKNLATAVSQIGDGGIQILKINLCGLLAFYIAILMTMVIVRG